MYPAILYGKIKGRKNYLHKFQILFRIHINEALVFVRKYIFDCSVHMAFHYFLQFSSAIRNGFQSSSSRLQFSDYSSKNILTMAIILSDSLALEIITSVADRKEIEKLQAESRGEISKQR